MSFSSDVKAELCKIEEKKPARGEAELYGMLLFAQSFSKTLMRLQTESYEAAKRLATKCFEIAGMDASIQVRPSAFAGDTYIVTVERPEDCAAIFAHMNGEASPSLRINHAILEGQGCEDAFLRGVFLSCGTMTDPAKEYQLEFSTPFFRLAADLLDLLAKLQLAPKSLVRKSNQMIYFKDSASIEDLLIHMGARGSAFAMMNVKIYKGLKNETNRRANCETANLNKTVSAASAQVEAIHKILRLGTFAHMPEELQSVAKARLENPYASLAELLEALPDKLTKSGLNHRLRRLVEFSEREDAEPRREAPSKCGSKGKDKASI